jgi:hypothetical protein
MRGRQSWNVSCGSECPSTMRSITIALCLFASVSLAQKSEPAKKPVLPEQNVNFGDGSHINGTLKHPTGEIYSVPPKAKFGSLIQVRMNFNDKLQESVHEM